MLRHAPAGGLFLKGLAAVERFTGTGIRREHLDRLEEADVAYRIQERS